MASARSKKYLDESGTRASWTHGLTHLVGELLARPMPALDFDDLLTTNRAMLVTVRLTCAASRVQAIGSKTVTRGVPTSPGRTGHTTGGQRKGTVAAPD